MSTLALTILLFASAKAGEEYEPIITLDLRDHTQFEGQTEARIDAYGEDDGHIYLALPEAVGAIDASGRFQRRAFSTRPPDMVGRFAVDGREIVYVSQRDQTLKRLMENGEVATLTARSEKLARGFAVFRGDGGDLYALVEPEGLCFRCVYEVLRFTKSGKADGVIGTLEYDLNAAGPRGPKVGVERAADSKKQLAGAPKTPEEKKRLDDDIKYWEGVVHSFAEDVPRRPCGFGPKGIPIAVTVNRVHTYGLAKLNRNLVPFGPPLWGIVEDEHIQEVERFEREAMQRALCDQSQDLVLLGWEHSGQMSLYRGTTPVFHAFVGMGANIYAILSSATLVAVLRGRDLEKGKVRLFGKKPLGSEPRGATGKDPLSVHRQLSKLAADPKNTGALVSMLDNMIDAGWWENAQTIAGEALAKDLPNDVHQKVETAVARARAAELMHYAEVEGSADVAMRKKEEAIRLAADHPASAVAQYAAALTLHVAGDVTAYVEHLDRTKRALEKEPGSKWADYVRLFDLFAARGDVASMKRFAAETKKSTTELDRRMFEARISRMEGAYDAALEALAPLADRYAKAVTLRGFVQMDAGKPTDAILSFTKANELGLSKDAETQHGLGLAYLRRGLLELSVESLSKAVTADPGNAVYASNLASAYAGLDKREDAMKHLFTALAKSPSDPVLRFQLENMSVRKSTRTDGALMVMPLSTYGGAVQRVGLGEMISSMLITAISEAGGPEVVERTRLDEVLAEQKLQATAHFDQDTTVRVGKLVGAKRALVGNVAELGERLMIDVRIVDVETGRVQQTKRIDSAIEPEALRKALSQLVSGVT